MTHSAPNVQDPTLINAPHAQIQLTSKILTLITYIYSIYKEFNKEIKQDVYNNAQQKTNSTEMSSIINVNPAMINVDHVMDPKIPIVYHALKEPTSTMEDALTNAHKPRNYYIYILFICFLGLYYIIIIHYDIHY